GTMFPRWQVGMAVAGAALVLAATRSGADGGFFPAEHGSVPSEPHQSAVIVYQNGIENLILQVGYEGAAGGFAWIVPTPGKPVAGPCAPKLFEQLDTLIYPPRKQRQQPRRRPGAFGGWSDPAPVRVLSRERIGIHDVAVRD